MEAIPELTYDIEHNQEPKEIGTIDVHTTFVRPANMAPILTRSRFSCSLPAKELIEDDASPHKQELHYFLTESGVDEHDARTLILQLIQLAAQVTSSVEYCPKYALSMWLTLDFVPSSQELVLDDPEIEESILASLADETKSRFRPANKLGVGSLSKRKYKIKRKASNSIADRCTICLKDFKTGRRVATLPCGHEFDNRCILEWLNISHFCPLCRYELPCEDDKQFQVTTLF